MIYMNVIILNLVIAIVGEVYDQVMTFKHIVDLNLKADVLYELYNLNLSFRCSRCCASRDDSVGYLYILRYVAEEDDEDDLSGKVNAVTSQIKMRIDQVEKNVNARMDAQE